MGGQIPLTRGRKNSSGPPEACGGSDTDDFAGAAGFNDGKHLADMSAVGLALALQDMSRTCPEMQIRLVAHSLGARVLLQTLQSLDRDPKLTEWRSAGRRVASVHLLGAAVDNEVAQTNEWGGRGIEHQARWAFNYLSWEDDVLEFAYPWEEGDWALGEDGIEDWGHAPSNYIEWDLTNEMGDDHYNYWAILHADGSVADIRALDDVLWDFN